MIICDKIIWLLINIFVYVKNSNGQFFSDSGHIVIDSGDPLGGPGWEEHWIHESERTRPSWFRTIWPSKASFSACLPPRRTEAPSRTRTHFFRSILPWKVCVFFGIIISTELVNESIFFYPTDEQPITNFRFTLYKYRFSLCHSHSPTILVI